MQKEGSIIGAKYIIRVSKELENGHTAYLGIPSDVIDIDHTEGVKYMFMKRWGFDNMRGINITIEDFFGGVHHSEKLEDAILEASGRPSKYLLSLMKAYHVLMEDNNA